MYINFQQNQAIRSVKSVDTKYYLQNTVNCINLQHAIRISKPNFFQTCITPMSISRPNLKTFSLVDIVKPRSKVISTDDKLVQ